MKLNTDNIKHLVVCFICSFLISVIIAHFAVSPLPAITAGFLGAMCLGAGKEYGDSKSEGNFWSWEDMLYNAIGAVIGSMGGFFVYII